MVDSSAAKAISERKGCQQARSGKIPLAPGQGLRQRAGGDQSGWQDERCRFGDESPAESSDPSAPSTLGVREERTPRTQRPDLRRPRIQAPLPKCFSLEEAALVERDRICPGGANFVHFR